MNKYVKILSVASGAVLLIVVAFLAYSAVTVKAQGESTTVKSQLEQLQDQMKAGKLMIGFQFVTPISEGKNYWLFGDPTDDKELSFVEIGDDHFCFSQRGGQAVLVRCVPYSNIASFDYLAN